MFVWTKECEAAFKNPKEALTFAPILTYPQPNKQFILDSEQCIASSESVGAYLSQNVDGQEHAIAYWNKCLSKPGRNFCTTWKELLAIVKSWSPSILISKAGNFCSEPTMPLYLAFELQKILSAR